MHNIDFLIQTILNINLPFASFIFLFYWVATRTNLPRHIRRSVLICERINEDHFHFLNTGEKLYENVFELSDEDEDKYKDDQINEDVKDEIQDDSKEEVKEDQPKEEVKFEDKYLVKFKEFSNEYFFTEEEMHLKSEKYNQLKAEFEAHKSKKMDELKIFILQTQKIVDMDRTDPVLKKELIIYFEIEDQYEDDPNLFDFDELFIYVENDHTRFLAEYADLEQTSISNTELSDNALKYVLDVKLDGFINNYVLETTPLGNVYMRYNNAKTSFEYFSNNTIPYRYLEAIGRRYVMTFMCKPLFIDLEEELKKALDNSLKNENVEKERDEQKASTDKLATKPTTSHKFKSYNKELQMDKNMSRQRANVLPPQIKANLPNVNTTGEKQLLKDNANRYTWEGRLANFSLLKKVDRKTVDKNYALSFADFKQMQQIKK
jgi:hypothetical protein